MAKVLYLLLLIGVFQCWKVRSQSEREVFTVTPDDTQEHCQSKYQCQTLQNYLQNVGYYFNSSTVIHFLPGVHVAHASEDISIIISNVTDLTLRGDLSELGRPAVSIYCNLSFEFCFVNVHNLVIENIEFRRCGFRKSDSECPMYIKGRLTAVMRINPQLTVPAALKLMSTHTVSITNVSIIDSYKYGMIAINTLGLCLISRSIFKNNSWGQVWNETLETTTSWPYADYIPWGSAGGNALFLYDDTATQNDTWHGLKITHSEISYGQNYQHCSDPVLRHQGCDGAGLGVYIKPISSGPLPTLYFVIEHTVFHDNTAPAGANLFVGHDYEGYKQTIKIYIHNSSFYNGRALHNGGGCFVFNGYPKTAKDYLRITNSSFFNNTATRGGGLYVSFSTGVNDPAVPNTCISINKCNVMENKAVFGAGLYAFLSAHKSSSCVHILNISQSIISHNTATKEGGGIRVQLPTEFYGGSEETASLTTKPFFNQLTRRIIFGDSLFNDNKAKSGSAILISACDWQEYYNSLQCDRIPHCIKTFDIMVLVQNASFSGNTALGTAAASVFHLHSIGLVKGVDLTFTSNAGSSILANQSIIYMEGQVLLVNNSAYIGGALHLACDPLSGEVSMFGIFPDTEITIANNTAVHYGGGISANQDCSNNKWCVFQFVFWNESDFIKVTLINNTAQIAGDSLYGGPIDDCYIFDNHYPVNISIDVFRSIFNFSDRHYISEVASSPYRICFCIDDSPENYCITNITRNVFRGQEFNVAGIISGKTRGAYAATVRTMATAGVYTIDLGARQTVQQLGRSCGNLTYSIRTSADYASLHLSVESTAHARDSPTVIHVTLLPCPFGFQLLGDPGGCGCLLHLSQVTGVTCDINTQSIHRPANVWIGNYSGDIIAHPNCPLDYCKNEESNVRPTDQDHQCASSRSGILCGTCQQGLSLALGTSKCLSCSNTYLLLVIPFMLVGFTLLFLLLKCNLTVSVGTLNGLIFYANIIQVNKTIFFPQNTANPFIKALLVFIAWLNVDLGVETCLFSGMNAYWKTWLQFLFPVYIWVLMGALVYSSRYSVTISKLAGSNAVPVLATLFLLSYAKLLRTIIAAISPIAITDRYGKQSLLWLLDGNMSFLGWPHVALVAMALTALFAYIIPLTLLALMTPLLQTWSGLKPLRWVQKMKPLLDAYQGPYKDRHRYWTGLMLVVRIILFSVFAGNALGDPKVNLLSIVLILMVLLVFLWNTGVVYKKYYVHLLETFYILNLAVLTSTTLYLKSSESLQESQEFLACVMVGSSFLLFMITLAWHLYGSLKKFYRQRQPLPPNNSQEDMPPNQQLVPTVHPQPTFSVVDLNALRESLLTDNIETQV